MPECHVIQSGWRATTRKRFAELIRWLRPVAVRPSSASTVRNREMTSCRDVPNGQSASRSHAPSGSRSSPEHRMHTRGRFRASAQLRSIEQGTCRPVRPRRTGRPTPSKTPGHHRAAGSAEPATPPPSVPANEGVLQATLTVGTDKSRNDHPAPSPSRRPTCWQSAESRTDEFREFRKSVAVPRQARPGEIKMILV